MYNAYASSTVYSIYDCSTFLNERCNRNPLHLSPSSSCCSCCATANYAFPSHRVPRGPSILYGSRQSVLLQWSISRRWILGGGNRFCYRFPEYECDRDSYEVPCSVMDNRVYCWSDGRRRRRCCMVSDSGCEFRTIHESNGFEGEGIADEIISLIGEEYFCCQEKIRSSKRAEVGNRGGFGGKRRSFSSPKRVEPEKRGSRHVKEKNGSTFDKTTVDRKRESDCQCCRGEMNTNKLSSLKSKQNKEGGSIRSELRKDEGRHNEGLFVLSREDSQSLRKGGSSSSYYSVSSSGNLEDDDEVEDKNVQFVEESQSRYSYDSGSDVGEGLDGQVKKEFKRQGDHERGQDEVSVLDITGTGTGVARHWRKNSEKKLNEVSTQVASCVRETSDADSRLSSSRGSHRETTSMSKKKLIDEEQKLKMAVTLSEQSKRYDISSKRVDGVFLNEGKEIKESEVSCSNTEIVSCSRKRFTDKNENIEINANLIEEARSKKKEAASIVLKEKSSRTSSLSQQLVGVSENNKIETKRISNQSRQSDATINRGESMDAVVTSTQETEERRHQTGKHVIGEMDPRKKFLHLGVISVIKDGNSNTSATSSETRTKNEEQNVALVNTSNPVNRDKKSQTDQKASQKFFFREGSRDATNSSLVSGTDKLSATQYQEVLENRIFKEETNKSFVEKSVMETRRRHSQNSERMVQIELGKEEEHSSSSQAMLMPPPSQLVARDTLCVDSTSEMASQVVSSRTSGSSSGALYMQSGKNPSLHHKPCRGSTGEPVYLITPDDALGSVDRLGRSSTQFVGEFIEKSRNELLISEIQKEEKNTEIDSVHDVEKYSQKSSSNYGSLDNKMKDHDSKHSPRSSGTKGPSDEMWHVVDSSVQQPPKADNPEISADSDNAIVKRSGRSLWNIISDIVHFRWSSRAETSDSALRSGGRTSPTESVSNETWFSGREHEESDNSKVGGTKTTEVTSSYQLEQPNPSARIQELSGDKNSKDTYNDGDMPSSTRVMESKISGGKLLVSGGIDLTDGRETAEVISYGLDTEQSSLPLPPQGIRRSLIIEEVSHNGENDAIAISSMERLELPHGATSPTTVSKDVELKQRKLQRNKQVLRDRFDEWEEAHILETEQRKIDEMFMREALAEAKKAADTWEVPVGAVLVKHGKIIARGYNLVEELRDSTAHAEMICIREASKQLKSWRLAETTLYVTLEPCPMCAGAILQARIDSVVWGAPNKLLGADGSWIRLFPEGGEGNVSNLSDKPAAPVHPFHPNMKIRRGVLASECADEMQQFFQLRRRKKERKENASPLTVAHHPSKFLNKLHNVFHIMFCL